jgi:unspecific monooxygenase
VEGARLSDGELISTIIVLLNAGHEASVNTTGNGIVAFARHPDEWRRVVGGEVEPAVAAEEMIRWDPPLQMFERYVLADGFSIGETPISMGEKVSLLFGSANRDPRQFPDPDRFDAGRNASHHVGFGGGIHFCIGAPLARIELAVTLRTLAARMPVLQLTDEPIRHPTFQFHGYQQVRLSAQ